MTYKIRYAYTCHIGKVRDNNEDNFWCCGDSLEAQNQGLNHIESGSKKLHEVPLYAVFDGMGGENHGEMAAYTATQKCNDYYVNQKSKLKKDPEGFFNELCEEMNNAVCEYSCMNHAGSMGTTVAAMTFTYDRIVACNLGDSRIYHFDGKSLCRMSEDHVLRRYFLGKAPLTQYLGMSDSDVILDPSISQSKAEVGDKYLICSDGITDMLSENEIADILSRDVDVTEIVKVLMDRALCSGGRDNMTIVLCEIIEEKNFFEKMRNWLGI